MQFSVGVEYALHCLLNIPPAHSGKPVGVRELASFHGVPEAYLSKMLAKLRKAGIVRAIPGVKGGYELARQPEEISFWDVVQAIEGESRLFQCAEIRQNSPLLDKANLPETYTKCPCLIKVVMLEAEEKMREHLKGKSIGWLKAELAQKLPAEQLEGMRDWFQKQK